MLSLQCHLSQFPGGNLTVWWYQCICSGSIPKQEIAIWWTFHAWGYLPSDLAACVDLRAQNMKAQLLNAVNDKGYCLLQWMWEKHPSWTPMIMTTEIKCPESIHSPTDEEKAQRSPSPNPIATRRMQLNYSFPHILYNVPFYCGLHE